MVGHLTAAAVHHGWIDLRRVHDRSVGRSIEEVGILVLEDAAVAAGSYLVAGVVVRSPMPIASSSRGVRRVTKKDTSFEPQAGTNTK